MLFSFNQIWALIVRYWIYICRYPIATLIRVLVWPAILIVGPIYVLTGSESDQFRSHFKFEEFIPGLLYIGTVFHVYHFTQWLIIDRFSGMKSLMLSMGLTRFSYYLSNSTSFLLMVLPYTVVSGVTALVYIITDSQSSPVSVILIYILFGLHLAAYVFVFASMITSTKYMSLVGIPIFFERLVVPLLSKWVLKKVDSKWQSTILFGACASPFESVTIFVESYMVCKNCNQNQMLNDKYSQPTSLIITAIIFWTAIAYMFARWFEEVCPWQNDTAIKKPFFCLSSNTTHSNLVNLDDGDLANSKYFEQSELNLEVGIRVERLTKAYRNVNVVNEVTLNIYKGETTLLLGHNGAGKTTMMNMILGKILPESGNVFIKSQHDYVQSAIGEMNVGICPQTSIQDENMTVAQHLELFARIKAGSMTGPELDHHIKLTMDDVKLSQHADKIPDELSGGMKRKLSLAMAFVGNSSILILDEPSSGLDPDSRVFIWNAIRRYRADRTVLLSTQHMEEADYLGDRIAVMNSGRIVCCGSNTFLNTIFGTGHKLRISCNFSRKNNISDFVKSFFPLAHVSTDSAKDDMFDIGQDRVADFIFELGDTKTTDDQTMLINLIQRIENDSQELGIISHGLKSSSLEDVLLNVGKAFDHNEGRGETSSLTISSSRDHLINNLLNFDSQNYDNSQMAQLYFLRALMFKNFIAHRREFMSTILFRLLLPILSIVQLIKSLNTAILIPLYKPNITNAIMILHFVHLPAMERLSKFKVMQSTTKANFTTYWLSFLLTDIISGLVNVLAFNILVNIFLDANVSNRLELALLGSVALFVFTLSGAMFLYLLTFIFGHMKGAIGYVILVFVTSSLVPPMLLLISLSLKQDISTYGDYMYDVLIVIFPTDALDYIFYGFVAKCYVTSPHLPCTPTTGASGVVNGMLVLCGQFFCYSILLYVIEWNRIDLLWYFRYQNLLCWLLGKDKLIAGEERIVDPDVIKESTEAIQLIKDSSSESHSLVAAGLSKSYIKGVKVVDYLSFTVKRAQCFGLLGVNGAGKSTTFSMIVGESKPESGLIWANKFYADQDIDLYQLGFGYDPQENLDTPMNSMECLTLMARLRGVSDSCIPMMVESILELLDMDEHAFKPAKNLSGGTKRKLSLGMSLIGNPALLALDEPTAGVDPIARRSVWHLLRSLRSRNKASIVISSHAMEECEAICDRIAIMARGRLRCIGSFLHLQTKFAKGCKIRVQYNRMCQNTAELTEQLEENLARAIGRATFRKVDVNYNSVTFEVLDNKVRRSLLFTVLRDFSLSNRNVGYMVNDSSLEDIFIDIAREQEQDQQHLERGQFVENI